jgi:hypothetical protein
MQCSERGCAPSLTFIVMRDLKKLLSASGLAGLLLLSGCSKPTQYHYSVFEFFPYRKAAPNIRELIQHIGSPALRETGEGNPDVCRYFFEPVAYIGLAIPIPKTAEAVGVVVVTNGRTSGIILLYSWADDKGATWYGCNGPTSQYARQKPTQDELIASIVAVIKKKTKNA